MKILKNIKEKFKVKDIVVFLLVSLILSLFIQINVFPNKSELYSNIEFDSIISKVNIINYTVKDNIFTAQNNDPQLLFIDLNSNVSAVEIDFVKPISQDMHIQIYFAENGENLCEQNSVSYDIRKGKNKAVIEIPYNKYSVMRVDIGSITGQSFELKDIKICESKITIFEKIISKIQVLSTLFLVFIFFILLCTIKSHKLEILNPKNKILEIIFLLFCFIMFTLWAIVQPFNSCPDESMRYDVIKYVFTYNRLPNGGDPLIRNEIWGFSYAFLPYLSGLISVVFMKIVSIFTMDEQALILGARMAIVCFGTLTVYYVEKIANKCFKNEYKWLFTILVCCLPQFVFLGSYMNNDMLSLLSVTMIIYYWIDGHEKNWDIKSSIGLAISVAICLLSYYNAYPFVLFSIIFFIWSNISKNVNKDFVFKKFMVIFIIVFILAGWWFIRNGIIYNGDFLGLRTTREYSNMYAREDIKPINHINPFNQGFSLLYMLFNMGWIKTTYLSFIGTFGYMSISIYKWMYIFYTFIIFIGLIYFIIKIFNYKKHKKHRNLFYLFMALAGITNISLSVYQSYTSGFQPQGRYIIQCLIPLMMFVTIGFKYMFDYIKNKFDIDCRNLTFGICISCILISVLCFTLILLPTYM